MAPVHRSDEQLDRLLAARDPLDRSVLSHEDVDAALNRLQRALAVPGTNAQRRIRRPVRRRLILPAGLVGALAVSLLVIGALLPAGGIHNEQFAPAPASAAIALERAAKTAERRPQIYPTARQYEYLAVEEATTSAFGQGANTGPPGEMLWGIDIWQSDTKRDWFKPNGSGRELIIETGRGFLTPRDRSVARAHHKSLDSMLPNQSVDGIYPAGGISWGYLSPARLPTRSFGLLQAVEHRMRAKAGGHRPAATDVFTAIGELLFESNSPPQRAGLYRALAQLPGVRLLGRSHDRLGRVGLAVEIVLRGSHGGPSTAFELIFNPATSDVLQSDSVLVSPYRWAPNGPTMPTGTVMGYTVFRSRGIVNSIDDLPGGGRLPYHPSVGSGTR